MRRNSRHSQMAEGFHFDSLRISSPLFADGVVLLGTSGGGIQLSLEGLALSLKHTVDVVTYRIISWHMNTSESGFFFIALSFSSEADRSDLHMFYSFSCNLLVFFI